MNEVLDALTPYVGKICGPIALNDGADAAQEERPAELTDLPAADDPQLAIDVQDVLRRLSPEHRAVLVLRDLEGMDEQAAAAVLDVPSGTAKSRLHRARASFRKAWSS